MDKFRIGFVGAGLMGLPMIANISKNKYPITVWNRSSKKLKKIKNKRITICKKLLDLPSQCEIIIMMLSNDKVCLDISKEITKKNKKGTNTNWYEFYKTKNSNWDWKKS